MTSRNIFMCAPQGLHDIKEVQCIGLLFPRSLEADDVVGDDNPQHQSFNTITASELQHFSPMSSSSDDSLLSDECDSA